MANGRSLTDKSSEVNGKEQLPTTEHFKGLVLALDD